MRNLPVVYVFSRDRLRVSEVSQNWSCNCIPEYIKGSDRNAPIDSKLPYRMVMLKSLLPQQHKIIFQSV